MEPTTNNNDIALDFSPFFQIFKDGSINRFRPPEFAPTTTDPITGVQSKDVTISSETGLSVRLYIPKLPSPTHKFPLLIYIHGGAFCLGSATTPTFHDFISSVVAEANVMAVSVDYRLAPEHPLPIAYDDSWTAFQWVISHANGKRENFEPWLHDHADFQRVFLAGESAGANICNDVAIRAGVEDLNGVEIIGMLLVHPFFGGKEEDKLYKLLCPNSSGKDDDPRLNPAIDPRVKSMRGSRVLFCFAEKDWLRDRGMAYCEGLKNSEWKGEVEVRETEGEGHGFHLFDPSSEKAAEVRTWCASFLNNC